MLGAHEYANKPPSGRLLWRKKSSIPSSPNEEQGSLATSKDGTQSTSEGLIEPNGVRQPINTNDSAASPIALTPRAPAPASLAATPTANSPNMELGSTTNDSGSSSRANGAGGYAPSQQDFERNFDDTADVDVSDSPADDEEYSSDYEDEVDAEPEELLPGLYRALYDFDPEGTAEMGLKEGQIVRVVGRGGGVGWAIAIRADVEGVGETSWALVPESYLRVVKLDEPDTEEGEEHSLDDIGQGTEKDSG
ncbi:hypothetical protein JB92DRAFT_1728620 [Gautieria morchelliformis]|nr:hypothetical protein JB92DRAFT_1728620 [Gautieria morchelliformis]